MTDRGLWSYRDIAAYLRVQPDTVRSYRKHGMLPPPDTTERGRPYWRPDTIREWVTRRPGYRGGPDHRGGRGDRNGRGGDAGRDT